MRIRRKRPFDLSIEEYRALPQETQRAIVDAYLDHLFATTDTIEVRIDEAGVKHYRAVREGS